MSSRISLVTSLSVIRISLIKTPLLTLSLPIIFLFYLNPMKVTWTFLSIRLSTIILRWFSSAQRSIRTKPAQKKNKFSYQLTLTVVARKNESIRAVCSTDSKLNKTVDPPAQQIQSQIRQLTRLLGGFKIKYDSRPACPQS